MAYEDYLVANLSTGLKGYWQLDEAAGPVIINTNGSFNGTLVGTPAAFRTAGIPGSANAGAMQFDIDSRVQLEAAPASNLRVSAFTIACWFRRKGAGLGTTGGAGTPTLIEPLVTKGRGEGETAGINCNYFLGINVDANPVLGLFYEEITGPGHQINGSTTIVTNTLYFGAVTYDGANMRLYLNGVEDTAAVPAAIGPDATSTQIAAIAGALTSTNINAGWFNGDIAHAAVWNVALSGSNVLALYYQGDPVSPTSALLTSTPVSAPSDFQVRISDAIGVDHSSVTTDTVKLYRNGFLLTANTDYTFSYAPNGSLEGTITLSPVGAAAFTNGAYSVTLNDV